VRVVDTPVSGGRERAPRFAVLPLFTVVSSAKGRDAEVRGVGREFPTSSREKTVTAVKWKDRFTDITSIQHSERRFRSRSYRKIGIMTLFGSP